MANIPLRVKRGTRAQINAAKSASTLAAGEPYLVTDEGRLAVGTASNNYVDVATKAEVDAKAASGHTHTLSSIGVATLVPPFIISPLQGTSGHPASVTLVASGYQPIGTNAGTHVSTDWEVSTDANFSTIVKSSYNDTVNKTAWTVTGLNANTTYYWRVRYTNNL